MNITRPNSQEYQEAITNANKTINEIHDLANKMSVAISTEIEQRYITDEKKLEAVLIENGWCKSTDLAREIFEEIKGIMAYFPIYGHSNTVILNEDDFAELKKKYTQEK